MQHCQSTVYFGDRYCADCGEQLEFVPKCVGVDEVDPNILNEVKAYYPNARAVTGQVLDSRYYKRRSRGSNHDVEYAFWWIKLRTSDEQIVETSISAESQYTQSIGRGDILTLYYPTEMTLYHKVQGKEAKRFVKDNAAVPCVVVHKEEGQTYTIENIYPRPQKKTAWLWLVLGALVAFYLFNYQRMPRNTIFAISALAAVATLLLEMSRNKTKFAKAIKKHDALNTSFQQLLGIHRYQLGYTNIARVPQKSDVICTSCNTRLPDDAHFCFHCGASQMIVEAPLLSHQNQEQGSGENELVVSETPEVNARFSVSEVYAHLSEQYLFQTDSKYLHRHVLTADREAKVTNEFMLGKVIATDVKNSVSDITTVTTTTTETQHYRGGYYSHSTHQTKESRFRSRSSDLRGKIKLELVNGDTYTLSVQEQILGDIDVGDWIAAADSDIRFAEENHYSFEYFYNITKDKVFHFNGLETYSDNRGSAAWWGWNALLIIAAIGCGMAGLSPISMLAAGACVLFNAFVWIKAPLNGMRNSRQRRNIMKPLQGRIAQFEASLENLRSKLEVLG